VINAVPSNYFANLDMNGRRIDLQQRAELLFGSCEFAVQNMYCARPPKPVSYLFAVDVSWNAQKSGMLQTWASALKHFLYSGQYTLPEGFRVGIVTFDRAVHFYNLSPELEAFSMLVVSDIDDIFSPIQEGLLVDPIASR
jgi:protein transport protein SEC24